MGNMDTTKCISDITWQAYAAGKLAAAEVQALHAHAASCEICADMLAGIEAMPDKTQLDVRIQSISNDIDLLLAKDRDGIGALNENAASKPAPTINTATSSPFVNTKDAASPKLASETNTHARKIPLYANWIAAAAVLLIAGFGLLQFQKSFEKGDVAKLESPVPNLDPANDAQVKSDAQLAITQAQTTPTKKTTTSPVKPVIPLEAKIDAQDDAQITNQSRSIASAMSDQEAAPIEHIASEKESEGNATSENKVAVDLKKEDLPKEAVSLKALTAPASVAPLNEGKENVSTTASISKPNKKGKMSRTKHIQALPANAAFSNQNELDFVQQNNAQNATSGLAQLPNDSLAFQNALGQYKREQLDSALLSIKPILPYPQLPYYEKCIQLQLRIMEKKKSGK
jgi:hypothetical protein